MSVPDRLVSGYFCSAVTDIVVELKVSMKQNDRKLFFFFFFFFFFVCVFLQRKTLTSKRNSARILSRAVTCFSRFLIVLFSIFLIFFKKNF